MNVDSFSFSLELHRLWYLALVNGGMTENSHFPTEVSGVSNENCTVCSQPQTELVIHESADGFPQKQFVHTECFEQYIAEYVEGKYVSIYEVVTVEQYPSEDLSCTVPDEVFDAYMETRVSAVEEAIEDAGIE